MHDLPSAELLAACERRDPDAEAELFRRYAERLVALARPRLSRTLAARLDPEDVVMSAWRSFFNLVREGRVEAGDGGLWPLLVRVALRKLAHAARRHTAARRSARREEPEAEVPSAGPGPAEAAALLDEVRATLEPLPAIQRRMVEALLQGHDADEIAGMVGRSARTVRRALAAAEEELQRRLTDAPIIAGDMDYGEIVLERQIGTGGMGKVYRARHRVTGEALAVKLLRKPLRGHAVAAGRFVEEARLLGRLRHPHIVAVHGAGVLPDGGLFLAMELCAGDLSRAEGDVIRRVAEAAEAVQYAHDAGVIHCDLKPSNILIARGGARVADFGLARLLGGDGPRGGTEGFLAPEQAAGAAVTPRADVYGLGAVLRALLGDAMPDVARRCLADDPVRRPAAGEVAAELRRMTP